MYVCVCLAVTDSQINNAVCSGSCRNMRELRQCLGVTSQCGRCGKSAHQVLKQALAETTTPAR